jgi:folate-binding Fe-S cluster repair protein YgfZ
MRGVDSFKLLQSLCTKKILTVVEADDAGEFCDYAAFLHNKGRVLTEALLMYRPTSKSWFIDVPSTSLQPLLEHIQQYKMRNRITIDVDEVNATYKTWTIVASTEANMKELSLWILNKTSQLELMFYQDPRFPLALRLIAPSYLNRTHASEKRTKL